MKLTFDNFETPLGDMTAACTETGAICLLDFTDCQDRWQGILQRRFGSYGYVSQNNPQGIRDRMTEYFTGSDPRTAFDGVQIDTDGTPFQRTVWQALQDIPYGETISYSELANRAASPKAVRAVGTANGRNPVAIIVPCHRVIARDGSLAGYAGGVTRKQKLLTLEGAL